MSENTNRSENEVPFLTLKGSLTEEAGSGLTVKPLCG